MPDDTPIACARPVKAASSPSNAASSGPKRYAPERTDARDRFAQLGLERLRSAGEVDDGDAAVQPGIGGVGGHRYHAARSR